MKTTEKRPCIVTGKEETWEIVKTKIGPYGQKQKSHYSLRKAAGILHAITGVPHIALISTKAFSICHQFLVSGHPESFNTPCPLY